MTEIFNSLPQFIQLCLGLTVIIIAGYAGITAVKARKIFSSRDPEPDEDQNMVELFAESRAKIYDKMERLSRHWDERFDKLEERVRHNEIDIARLHPERRRD